MACLWRPRSASSRAQSASSSVERRRQQGLVRPRHRCNRPRPAWRGHEIRSYSSRTCVDINVRRVWRTSTRGAAKPSKPSGMGNFCRVHEETIETCAFFRSVTTILPTKRPPFWGSKNGPQNGVHSFQSQFDLLVFCRQNFCRRAKNSASFDCFRGYATGFAYRWVSMILQRHEQLFATPCKHVCPHMLLNCSSTIGKLLLPWAQLPKHPLHLKKLQARLEKCSNHSRA